MCKFHIYEMCRYSSVVTMNYRWNPLFFVFFPTMHQKLSSHFFFMSWKRCLLCLNSHAHTRVHHSADKSMMPTHEQRKYTHPQYAALTQTCTHQLTQTERKIKALQPLATQGERDCIRWTLYLICSRSVWEKNHLTLFWVKLHLLIHILTHAPQYLVRYSDTCTSHTWKPRLESICMEKHALGELQYLIGSQCTLCLPSSSYC